jgi:ubiquitin carboxyl-terminal hydrolase 7
VLQDKLEEKMKGSPVDGTMKNLFVGTSQTYIECLNVDYVSKRDEHFYDLSLNVKGMPTLLKSFENYIEVEMLTGSNQYRAEKFGLQDARKGSRFIKFPPVLQMQLKRFEYDPYQDQMVKVCACVCVSVFVLLLHLQSA